MMIDVLSLIQIQNKIFKAIFMDTSIAITCLDHFVSLAEVKEI